MNKILKICWITISVLTLIVVIIDYFISSIEILGFTIYVNLSLIELFLPLIVVTIIVLINLIIDLFFRLINMDKALNEYCDEMEGV